MQKTKLGVTVGLLGAAVYFMGLISIIALVLLVGYVLLFETNEWLKRSAVKAVTIVVAFTLVSVVFGFGNDVFGVINGILSWFGLSFQLAWPFNLNSIAIDGINAIQKLVLVVSGLKALYQGSLPVSFIDRVVDRNI